MKDLCGAFHGKAIREWANSTTAYLNVVQELPRIIDAEAILKAAARATPEPAATRPSTARYRAKRQFDSIEGLRGRFVDRGATSFGATIVNGGHRNGTAHITVHCRNSHVALSDLYYSFSGNAGDNTANGGFNLSVDDYEQFLIQTMNIFAKLTTG